MKQPRHPALKKLLSFLAAVAVVTVICITIFQIIPLDSIVTQAQTVSVKTIDSEILADGAITSDNEVVLHFQTGGKLTYLPFKEGDSVTVGQTIARLDTYALQRQLSQALNTYKTTRDTFDQTEDNANSGVLQGQEKYTLDVTNKSGISGQDETNVIGTMVQRIVDQNQANLNSSVVNVELANYALQLASLTTPISGVITQEDVKSAGVNVTPLTTFVIDDPTQLVFRANVLENDIDFIALGQPATIKTSGGKTYQGTVSKIYPEKVTLPTGDKAYQVDVTPNSVLGERMINEAGSVLIQSTLGQGVILIPTWTILDKKYVWVDDDGQAVMKTVTVGQEHGNLTEITAGLTSSDKVIENPESLIAKKYKLLSL